MDGGHFSNEGPELATKYARPSPEVKHVHRLIESERRNKIVERIVAVIRPRRIVKRAVVEARSPQMAVL
jgi:hypothetical protein